MSDHVKGMTSCRPPESEISNEKSNLNENSLKESENLQPTCNQLATDCISRRAAINAIKCDTTVSNIHQRNVMIARLTDAIKRLPSAQPYTETDIQKMQDLYQAEIDKAFELGREDARSEIIHCGECKHRDPEDHKCDCGHDILWQLPRDDEWYCADAERKEGEADG